MTIINQCSHAESAGRTRSGAFTQRGRALYQRTAVGIIFGGCENVGWHGTLRRAFYHRTEMKSVTSWPVYPLHLPPPPSTPLSPLSLSLHLCSNPSGEEQQVLKHPQPQSYSLLMSPASAPSIHPSIRAWRTFISVRLVRAPLPRAAGRGPAVARAALVPESARLHVRNKSGNIITHGSSFMPPLPLRTT